MSEDELKRIEDEGCGCAIKGPDCCVEALVAEVRRLKALIELGQFGYDEFCPWCGGGEEQATLAHADDCPAWTPEGKLR